MALNILPSIRDTVTPVTVVTFIVSTVTGVMLLVHWNASLVRFSHEWLSMVFSAVALWHLARNWRSFTGYLRRHAALAVFAVSILASVVFTGMTGTPSSGGGNPRAVFNALSNATLASAAPAFGMTPDEAVVRLKSANIVAQPDDTLADIGKRHGRDGFGIASLLATKPQP